MARAVASGLAGRARTGRLAHVADAVPVAAVGVSGAGGRRLVGVDRHALADAAAIAEPAAAIAAGRAWLTGAVLGTDTALAGLVAAVGVVDTWGPSGDARTLPRVGVAELAAAIAAELARCPDSGASAPTGCGRRTADRQDDRRRPDHGAGDAEPP